MLSRQRPFVNRKTKKIYEKIYTIVYKTGRRGERRTDRPIRICRKTLLFPLRMV